MVDTEMPITGKVAEVLDKYSLVINRGRDSGVEVGMIFAVMGFGGEILDPETNESLGPRPVEKLRVRVTDVYEKFSVAETYRVVSPKPFPNFLDDSMNRNWAAEVHQTLGGIPMPGAPVLPERERVAGAPDPGEKAPTTAAVHVRLGDSVRLVRR